MNPQNRKRQRGWTMLEMICAVGIISVIAGFSTGVTAGVRRNAQCVACAHNLRQIGNALIMYQSENSCYPMMGDALPDALAKYISAPEIFVCPRDRGNADSYSPFYVPRQATEPDGFLIGCPRHGSSKQTNGLYGNGRTLAGDNAGVKWNDKPVPIGTVVKGGQLKFADGTIVDIKAGLDVIVMVSFNEAPGKIYSAIRIPNGQFGWVHVQAAHGTHFDVVTAAATAGVRGTDFYVYAEQTGTNYRTRVQVLSGVVRVEYPWSNGRAGGTASLKAGDILQFVVPKVIVGSANSTPQNPNPS